jgi:hypothetical protein
MKVDLPQRRRLKRHTRDFERPGHRLLINHDLARGRHFQAGGELHERRFTAAGWSHDGNEFAALHLQVNGFYREVVLLDQLVVVGEPDILKVNEPGCGCFLHALPIK